MAKPSVKQKNNKSNIFVRAINKFSNLHAPAKVLVLALVIGVIGGGGYAVYMSSAAGWTYMGQYTSYNTYTRSSITFNVYSCKNSVPKKGYQTKSMAKVMKITGTPAKSMYSVVNQNSGVPYSSTNKYTIAFLTDVPKLYQETMKTAYHGYSTINANATARLQDHANNGPGQSAGSSTFSKPISSISTCP